MIVGNSEQLCMIMHIYRALGPGPIHLYSYVMYSYAVIHWALGPGPIGPIHLLGPRARAGGWGRGPPGPGPWAHVGPGALFPGKVS